MSAPILPEERWQGLWSPTPMERLVDGYAQAVATSGATPPLTDYADVDESLLPFLAWQSHAIGFYAEGSETQRREALHLARRLNRLLGTEAALDLLGEINNTTIRLRYLAETTEGTPYLRHKNVDVDIVQPPAEAIDGDLLEYLRHACVACIPYTLQLRRVNLLSVITITERTYITTRGTARGWIVGGEQWQ